MASNQIQNDGTDFYAIRIGPLDNGGGIASIPHGGGTPKAGPSPFSSAVPVRGTKYYRWTPPGRSRRS